MRPYPGMFVLALVLAACTRPAAVPQITYDAADFSSAMVEPEVPRPKEIVETPVPLPLPGQLKPLAPGRVPSDDQSPHNRVSAANTAAKVEPVADGYINAMQVYPYTQGALYQLYAAPEQVTNIALQPGEEIVALSAGDTLRWIIGDVVSGDGAAARAHVLIKPVKEGLKSNLVIITDRRAYHLELHSTAETYMASVSWTYPQDTLLKLRRGNTLAEKVAGSVIADGLALDKLKFRYKISGDSPPWRPLRVFDDTHKVYIQFPARLDQGEAPPLFVLGPKGDTQLVNYRMRGNYYIVDRLFAAAELRLGQAPQQVVRILRTDDQVSRAGGGQ